MVLLKNMKAQVELQDFLGTTSIDANASFLNNTNITSVFIPDKITQIPDSQFNGCTNLAGVTFGRDTQTEYDITVE